MMVAETLAYQNGVVSNEDLGANSTAAKKSQESERRRRRRKQKKNNKAAKEPDANASKDGDDAKENTDPQQDGVSQSSTGKTATTIGTKDNFKNASELKPVKIVYKAGASYDPFSRRWTRLRNYYASKSGEKAAAGNNCTIVLVVDAGINKIGVPVTLTTGMVAIAATLEAHVVAGKSVDTSF